MISDDDFLKLCAAGDIDQTYFLKCCEKGDIELAKRILSTPNININRNLDYSFRWSCEYGHKKVAESLYILSKLDGNIKVNINAKSDFAFRFSCANGHKEVAKWLYDLSKTDDNTKVNINAESDFAFRESCANGYKEVAEYLASLCPDYEVEIENNEIKSYKIITLKDKIKDKTLDEIIDILNIKKEIITNHIDDNCYICLGEANLKYECNHWTCLNCMIQWAIVEDKHVCGICKKHIEFDKMTLFI